MDSFKRFSENKLTNRYKFFSSLKDECLVKKIIYMLLIFGMCLK